MNIKQISTCLAFSGSVLTCLPIQDQYYLYQIQCSRSFFLNKYPLSEYMSPASEFLCLYFTDLYYLIKL